MRAVPLKQHLSITITMSLMRLVVGMIGLGVAIRRGQIVPPTLDGELSIVRIVGYRTRYPDCPPHTLCPLQSVAPPEEYYVIWSIYELATADQPYGRTARRLLVMPLNPR